MRLLLIIATVLLISCAVTQPSERTFPLREISSDLRIDPMSLTLYHRCFHAIAPKGATSAHYYESACLRDAERFIFARPQRSTGRYATSGTVPLRDITAVRLAKSGAARQLHLETDAGVHVVMLLLDDGLPRINVPANEAEYAFLAQRRIPAQETTAYMGNSNRGPVVVPLIVR